ncbi:MAG: MarR family winged helix-turn-helix transcriptional regulator [Sphingopyxis sp.]|nr:MarR family winged helix-turn-helix transcriptional regulator [Sphingopyxis sp.]
MLNAADIPALPFDREARATLDLGQSTYGKGIIPRNDDIITPRWSGEDGDGSMMDHGVNMELDTTAFPPKGFVAWDAGPPETVGEPLPKAIASPLLFVGPRSNWPDLASLAEVSLANALPPSGAANYIRQTSTLDIVWLAAADAIENGMLIDICRAVHEQGCNFICETSLTAIDRVAAAIPPSLDVHFLVDADATDRLVALAAARRTRYYNLHDIARGDAMERIDQLQEEVARIARLLGDLAGQRGGLASTPTVFAPRGDDFADYPAQVRSPPRDYAAIPRSFVPEERALDRQRAKAVRRMLRQRRMREQYFPADLFADPAWDMLLDLYAARLERQPVSVSSLCIAAAVPATTALRWIKTMTDAGLFAREADPHDGRRIFIALAEGACDALARYFEALEE